MENALAQITAEISRFQPVPWSQIPDLGLYMDQVITFITRAYEPLYGESTKGYLSAPMINNYVKNKLIPRPVGKKYSRMQVAMLFMIVTLKRVCTMEDIRAMLRVDGEEAAEALYSLFCQRQSQSICDMLAQAGGTTPAMDFAIISSSYRAGCECLLQRLATESTPSAANEER